MRWRKNQQAFSLMEMIFVLIVLGALMGLALPRYFISVEKMRAQEGMQTLLVLLASQKRYFIDHNTYQAGSGPGGQLASTDLDIDIGNTKYFVRPYILIPNILPDPIARVFRNTNPPSGTDLYRLDIDQEGNISCLKLLGSLPGDYCKKLGFY